MGMLMYRPTREGDFFMTLVYSERSSHSSVVIYQTKAFKELPERLEFEEKNAYLSSKKPRVLKVDPICDLDPGLGETAETPPAGPRNWLVDNWKWLLLAACVIAVAFYCLSGKTDTADKH